jgi:hypothetical protein
MTTPPSALPPANWYPDPQTPGQLRYWDGQRWTQHTHVAQQPAQGVGGFAASNIPRQVSEGYAPSTQPTRTVGGFSSPGVAMGTAESTPSIEELLGSGGGAGVGVAASSGPRAAGPATGGTFLPTGQVVTGVPANGSPSGGSVASFQPGAVAGQPGSLRVPTPKVLDDDSGGDSGTPEPPQTLLAFVFGVAALGATVLSIYRVGTPVDDYLAYAGVALGFLSVLFGLVGRRRAIAGLAGGAMAAWFGIGIGFFTILLSTFELMSPGELHARIQEFLGG